MPHRFECCDRAEDGVHSAGKKDLHHDENGRHNDALNSAAQQGIRNDGKRLVDNHVRQEESYKQQMAILSNRLDLVGVFSLVSKVDNQVNSEN